MRNVTYITDTNNDPKHHVIITDEDFFLRTLLSEWFRSLLPGFLSLLPGDEIITLRRALIKAAMRLSGEDRELLTSNGFVVTTIPVIYSQNDNIFASHDDYENFELRNKMRDEFERCGIEKGYADTYAALSVFEHLGGDVKKFIK